jgi:hypothetical protein
MSVHELYELLHDRKRNACRQHLLNRSILILLIIVPLISGAVAAGLPQMEWSAATYSAPFSSRFMHSSVVFNGSLWVIGGESNQHNFYSDVWRSDDGQMWMQETPDAAFGPRAYHGSVVFHDLIWVIAGRSGSSKKVVNDIWSSEDGITWEKTPEDPPFAPRVNPAVVVFNDKIWVIGGTMENGIPYPDVWYSSDGITWTQATSFANFTRRGDAAACVYEGKIWLTGGINPRGQYNDVWSSEDGINWARVSSDPAFPAIRYHHMVSAYGKLWIIGGYGSTTALNDIWYSTDGITWIRAEPGNIFTPRWGFTTAVYDNELWVISGNSGNSVWHSEGLGSSGSPESGIKDSLSHGISITKEISPVSLKQGKEAKITVTVYNHGALPIHDIEILDTTVPELPVIDGISHYTVPSIGPDDARILTYTVRAEKAGSYRLNKTKVLYADADGNYNIAYSDSVKLTVLAPLLTEADEGTPDDILGSFMKFVNGLNLFAYTQD